MNHDVSPEAPRGIRVADAAWPAVQARLQAGATAVLPVGAASKQHGRHLPMNTDFLQAEWLADELVRRTHVAVWPTVGYGHYPAFVDYPGSCSLSAGVFQAMVRELFDDILRAGAHTLVIVNTGLSTITPLQQAILESTQPDKIKLANVYDGPRYRDAVNVLQEQARGSHADELETSIMMVVAPDKVWIQQAEACAGRDFRAGPFSRTEATHPNYSPGGVYGDPLLATKDKGQRLLQAMLRDLLDFFDND